jgi:hypothetical protein
MASNVLMHLSVGCSCQAVEPFCHLLLWQHQLDRLQTAANRPAATCRFFLQISLTVL